MSKFTPGASPDSPHSTEQPDELTAVAHAIREAFAKSESVSSDNYEVEQFVDLAQAAIGAINNLAGRISEACRSDLCRVLYPEGIKHPQQGEWYWMLQEVGSLRALKREYGEDEKGVIAFAFHSKLFLQQIVRDLAHPTATQRLEFDRSIGKKAAELLAIFPDIALSQIEAQSS